ncbi:MAG: hypothetical protein HC897_09150 [Thermoanaerobaculia bacterium]|nr:hypothetical protein [Thermoanaerobaculia bacterium]
MSLKAFHVFFIAVATVFATALGVWLLAQALYHQGGTLYLVLGPLCFVGSIALIVYGQRFLKKMKDVSYL